MSEAPSCIRGVLVPSVRSKPYLNRRIEVQPRCLVTPVGPRGGRNCARMEPLFAGDHIGSTTGVAPCGWGRFGVPTTRKGRGVQPSHRLSLSGNSVARLEDKIVLIAGAAGAIGQAVAAAVQREGGVAVATDLGAPRRHRSRPRRHGRKRLAQGAGRGRARAWSPRRPRQCRRHRVPRQHRGHRLCLVAAGAGGQPRRYVSRLQARARDC